MSEAPFEVGGVASTAGRDRPTDSIGVIPLRILYTHRTQGVGAEGAHIMGMVEAFRADGHEVDLDGLPGCDPFTKDSSPAPTGPHEMRGSRPGGVFRLIAEHAPQSLFGLMELAYNLPLGGRLAWKMRRRPDLVYERYAVGNFAPAMLCRLRRAPLVVEVNDSVVIERSRPLTFPRVKRRLERRVLSGADLIITITRRFKEQLLEAFPELPESKVLVLPNAVSAERFRAAPAEATAALRERLGLGRRTVLGNIGQFLPWHGLAPFVTAAAGMARERDLAFLFIGDGPARDEVMEAARAGGVEDRVVFTGMVPHAQVPDYLSLLDVAVIPSAAVHASPMKLMEFMAMGLPVIAPDLPNIREALEDGRTGRLFPPDDMAGLCRLLAGLLEDREAARSLGRRAREHVLAHLTWAGHARAVLEALGRRRALRGAAPCPA